MRISGALGLLLLLTGAASAQHELGSPYRQQSDRGLRGLDDQEIADLRTGTGMGLARAAELNSYPGPRHVLDAIASGSLTVSPEQLARVRLVYEAMEHDARRVGAEILEEEARLEAAFRSAVITDPDLHARVARIATLRGDLRAIHLAAHLATRRILSDAQTARYNELRGYAPDTSGHRGHQPPKP
ncbi:MAG TPA: hypothetical protein VEL75_18870 [Candidatus Methylomirabilis sp.]|nr:hypothetical protein [Candidatus Methylomirabilis sp.]